LPHIVFTKDFSLFTQLCCNLSIFFFNLFLAWHWTQRRQLLNKHWPLLKSKASIVCQRFAETLISFWYKFCEIDFNLSILFSSKKFSVGSLTSSNQRRWESSINGDVSSRCLAYFNGSRFPYILRAQQPIQTTYPAWATTPSIKQCSLFFCLDTTGFE